MSYTVKFVAVPDLKALKSSCNATVEDIEVFNSEAKALDVMIHIDKHVKSVDYSEREMKIYNRSIEEDNDEECDYNCKVMKTITKTRKKRRLSNYQNYTDHPNYKDNHKEVEKAINVLTKKYKHLLDIKDNLTVEGNKLILSALDSLNIKTYNNIKCSRICFICGSHSHHIPHSILQNNFYGYKINYPIFFNIVNIVICNMHAGERLVEIILCKTIQQKEEPQEFLVSKICLL